jgi:hypothetical protein
VRSPLSILLLVAVLLLGACNGEEGRPGPTPDARTSLIEAAERTLEAGPAHIEATLRSDRARYELDGRLDPTGGYRLCAVIAVAPNAYSRDRLLWLEGRAGTYGTLTTGGRRCARRALWLDDHPPTLPLHTDQDALLFLARGPGAEDFLHAALLALTGLDDRSVIAARMRACGRSRCYRTEVDFEILDRKSSQRDEDRWTLRPLLRSLARHHVMFRADPDGFLDRVSLTGRRPTRQPRQTVRVEFELSSFGDERPVPLVSAQAIE